MHGKRPTSTSAFATGGRGQLANSAISRFISGDSKNGLENKEQVSIDWDNQSYNVKPIPVGNSSTTSNASGIVKGMSSAERNSPMLVSIAGGLVSHSGNSISDDGSKVALKVYPINNFITDQYEIGDGKYSMIQLVYSIDSRLKNIEEINGITAGVATGSVEANRVNTTLLTRIASGIENISKHQSQQISDNPFASARFPSELDSIIAGY